MAQVMDLQLLTSKQAAELLGLSEATLRSWRSAGKGPAYVNLEGRAVRYRACDIDAWIKAGLVASSHTAVLGR